MKVVFFEIPCSDFERAVRFYRNVFWVEPEIAENEKEKMAFLTDGTDCRGAISYSPGFLPGETGVLVSFECPSIAPVLRRVMDHGGSVVIPETALEAEIGRFAVFRDSEGNRIGLWAR